MTLNVSVKYTEGEAGFNEVISVNDLALKLARFSFNPSGKADVTRLKALASAFIAECHHVQSTNSGEPNAIREAAVAITLMQQAAMMAVGAATFHLLK